MGIEAKIDDMLIALESMATSLASIAKSMETAALPTTTVHTAVTAAADTEETPAPPPVKKKAAKKKAAKKKAVEPAAEPLDLTPESTESAEPAVALTKEYVGARLREIAGQITDTNELQAIISDLGGERFSDLGESEYPSLLNRAEALVATDA